MRLSKTSTALEVRAVLLKEGKSIAGWAREYGFNPVHAARYLLRWSDREKRPRGHQTRTIIEALEKDTGIKICG